MRRIPSRHFIGLPLLALLPILCSAALPAQAGDPMLLKASPNEAFKQHISTQAAPEVLDVNAIKAGSVNAKVIQQIGRAREVLQPRHGANYMVPGNSHATH